MDFKKNLDTLAAVEKGFTYTVVDLDGVETDCTVDVIGVGSRIYSQAKQRIEAVENKAKSRGKVIDEDEYNALYIDLIAKCTKGWKNVENDGKKVEFSYENAVQMYTDYPVFRNQILNAVHDVKAMLEGK